MPHTAFILANPPSCKKTNFLPDNPPDTVDEDPNLTKWDVISTQKQFDMLVSNSRKHEFAKQIIGCGTRTPKFYNIRFNLQNIEKVSKNNARTFHYVVQKEVPLDILFKIFQSLIDNTSPSTYDYVTTHTKLESQNPEQIIENFDTKHAYKPIAPVDNNKEEKGEKDPPNTKKENTDIYNAYTINNPLSLNQKTPTPSGLKQIFTTEQLKITQQIREIIIKQQETIDQILKNSKNTVLDIPEQKTEPDDTPYTPTITSNKQKTQSLQTKFAQAQLKSTQIPTKKSSEDLMVEQSTEPNVRQFL